MTLGSDDLNAAPSDNNVVGASARLRRAPEYTARRLWWSVGGGGVVCPNKADDRSCLAPRRQPPNVIGQVPSDSCGRFRTCDP
jgi:hypothetical protein